VSDVASREWNEENGRSHRAFLDETARPCSPAASSCHPPRRCRSAATTRRGSHQTGPFIQADKGIGGFYLIEADNLDEAVERARAIPEASGPHSGVEVRRLHEASSS